MDPVQFYRIYDSVIELAAFFVGAYCFLVLWNHSKEKKTKIISYLKGVVAIFALGPIFQFLDGLFYHANVGGIKWEVQYGYSILCLILPLINILLLFFAIEVFMEKRQITKREKALKIIFIVGEIVFALLSFIFKLQDKDITYYIGGHMILSIIMYFLLGKSCFNLAKKIDEDVYSKSIKTIGIFSYMLLGLYIFFILDSFSSTYTLWGAIGWTIYLVDAILIYYGFIKPMNIQE